MVITLDQLKEQGGRLASDSHGEAVYEKITETVKQGNGRGRWFWELLQNAMDAVDDDKSVSVELRVSDSELVFRHDGNPFNVDEILKLIIQGTTKKHAKDKKGRFGTGFISTYLLSRKVRIEGLLEEGPQFSFVLDRMAESSDDFIRKQGESIPAFYHSFKPASGFVWTSFTYYLNPNDEISTNNVKEGVRLMDEIIPFVLAFNKKFEQITINDHGQVRVYSLGDESIEGSIRNREISVSTGQRFSVLRWVEGDQWQAGYKLQRVEGQWSFWEAGADFPNLFLSFPLIGTDVLGLPIVIHSNEFDVKSERNGAYLGVAKDTNITRNKQIIDGAVDVIGDIIKWATARSIGKIYHAMLFRTGTGHADWLDKDWLKTMRIRAMKSLTVVPAVYSCVADAQPITVASSYIPFHEPTAELRVRIFELAISLFPGKLPAEDREKWYKFCLTYKEIMNIEKEPPSFYFTLAAFCGAISGLGGLDGLRKEIKTDVTVTNWLKGFYETISGAGEKVLFSNHAILPTYADGGFRKHIPTMRYDEVRDSFLLDITFIIDPTARERLVLSAVDLPKGLCESWTKEGLVDLLMPIFTKWRAADYSDPQRRKANILMLKWLIDTEGKDRIKVFPVISREKGKEKEEFSVGFLGSFEKSKRLLAPMALWKDKFPCYAEMVRHRDVMDKDYFEVLGKERFAFLAQMGLIHLSPLVRQKDIFNQQLLERLVVNRELFPGLVGPDGVLVKGEVEYTDFAYLGSSDDQLLSSTSFANSARILTFLLKEAVEMDAAFDESYAIFSPNSTPVLIMRALWVGRLRNNVWVSVKREGGGVMAEPPSSQNLAGLIREKQDLKSLIQSEKARKLLSMWGVSVSDLLRNLLSNESVRAAWDRAFIDLLSSNLDPEEASEIAKDEKFRNEYRERKERYKKIRENQDLGKKMEKAFQDLFQRPEYAHLKVTRKPIGRDFDMEFDLINDQGEEEVLEIGTWWLELKATGKDYAAMTALQGEKAAKMKDHYALVVLPLNGEQITEETILSRAKFVRKIGYILEAKYREVERMYEQQEVVVNSTDELEVSLEGEQLRYNVRKKVWQEQGVDLATFLQLLNNQYADT